MTTTAAQYPKRLIEVDLPIRRISAHARREKSIRHGHISTLHIWWARRPLAACRAVICAALWPDPADPLCPPAFRAFARDQMQSWANHNRHLASAESLPRIEHARENSTYLDDLEHVRLALLDFIADFANWDNSTNPRYLETSRALTQSAHEALGGEPGTRPLVVDPFAGGGAIPLEALRVGADAFASDLNPVAVLLNKVVLEYIPKYGQRLADEVRKWGKWIQEQAEKELAEFYPKDPDGATPIAYLWARTIRCEGPGCGAEVPLIRSLWLSKKRHRTTALRIVANRSTNAVDIEVITGVKSNDVQEGTIRKGSAICPMCGYTNHVSSVRHQLKYRRGGTSDARLFCVVTTKHDAVGRQYRPPTQRDRDVAKSAATFLSQLVHEPTDTQNLSPVPNETLDIKGIRHTWAMIYGLDNWSDYYTTRQAVALAVLCKCVSRVQDLVSHDSNSFAIAVQTSLGLAVSRLADRMSSVCTWRPQADQEKVEHTFARQALPMTWDFAEGVPISAGTAGWIDAFEPIAEVIKTSSELNLRAGSTALASATQHPLPDSITHTVITDPPYYDAVPYSFLSDYFYVWLRRCLGNVHQDLFAQPAVPKDAEVIVDRPHELSDSTHDVAYYEQALTKAFREANRILAQNGICAIVFASKTTASWEAILQAVVNAGWKVTGSWPIDTEMGTRVSAQGQARLASSIHLVCRPRDSSSQHQIGDWREVLAELPQRIHDWMPRLVAEGIVGADAIFACLGPAVEIFSRYERVEKASGEVVTLREYLPYVWAAVSREALSTIIAEADTTGFEEDARLTALWLWTLFGGVASQPSDAITSEDDDASDEDDDEATPSGKPAPGGSYILEFDAARKIAQGLGAHLERLTAVVEVKGEKARLLPVAERARTLFGKEHTPPIVTKRKHLGVIQGALPGFPSKPRQGAFEDLFGDANPGNDGASASDDWADTTIPDVGGTVLDRLHQSMLLFASGRGEALRRFLVENGIGHDERFWRLAQALSALYPMGSDEKRWVDGVLARKKGWGM